MRREIPIAAVLMLSLAAGALAQLQGEVLDVSVAIEERAENGSGPFLVEARFLAASGAKSVWSQERRAPGAAEGAPAEFVGSRIACVATATDDGATFHLEIEIRRPAGDQVAGERLELAGQVPFGDPVEVATIRTSDPDEAVWVVRVACRRTGVRHSIPAAPAGAAEPAEAGDRSIRLQGVMVDGDGPSRAILSVSGQILEVEVGDLVPGDWQVSVVDAGGVTLRGAGGVTRRLAVR